MRACGGRGGFNLGELKLVVVIVLLVALCALPFFISFAGTVRGRQLDLDCLAAMAGALNGKKDAVCPASKKPFPAGAAVSCPDPEKHLAFDTSLARADGGAWTLRQSLPSPPSLEGGSVPGASDTLRLEAAGPVRRSISTHGWAVRWILGSLVGLFLFGATAGLLWECFESRRDRPGKLGAAAFAFVMGVLCIGFLCRTTTVEIDGPQRRVSRQVRCLGVPVRTQVYDGVVGVAAVQAGAYSLAAALVPEGDRFQTVEIAPLPEPALGAAAWFAEALRP